MLFYLTIVLFLGVGVVLFDIKKQTENKSFFLLVCFLLLVIMSSIRYRVGGDSLSYEDYYDGMPNLNNYVDYLDYNPFSYQPLWLLFVAICKSISSEFYVLQIMHALLFNLSLFLFINKHTTYVFSTLLLLFFSLLYFYYSFEILRESLAISVFLFNIENLEKKRWTRYYALVLISFLFHISAFFLFFLPLLKKIELTKMKIYFLLFFAIVLFFLKGFIFSVLTPFLILEAMKNKADTYSEMTFSLVGFLAFFSVRVLLVLPFLFYRISTKVKTFRWLDFSFLIFSIMAQYFVGFERLLNYFYIIYFVLFVNFIYENERIIFGSFIKKIIIAMSFMHVFFIMDYKIFAENIGQYYYCSLFYPYENIFTHNQSKDREDYYYNLLRR